MIPLVNFTQHRLPFLWQASEWYFTVRKKAYRVKAVDGKTIQLEKCKIKNVFPLTLLKVISYATVILPLIALIIRTHYRKQYTFEILMTTDKPRQGVNASNEEEPTDHLEDNQALVEEPLDIPASLKEAIEAFKENYKNNHPSDDVKSAVFKMYGQDLPSEEGNVADLHQKLDNYLIDLDTYANSSEEINKILYQVLHGLLQHPEKLIVAKVVYKKISDFLRKNTSPDCIKKYEAYLNGIWSGNSSLNTPARFLFLKEPFKNCHAHNPGAAKATYENQAELFHLLKHLRKHIKLIDIKSKKNKQNKIQILTKEFIAKEKIAQKLAEKALEYIGLTWLHGTKAFVIQSACTMADRELLPIGLLKERNIQLRTGEMSMGAIAVGVNQGSLSGANLTKSEESIKYATTFDFDLNNEINECQKLLEKKFNSFESFLQKWEAFAFTRTIEALKRVKKLAPGQFKNFKEALKTKEEEIYLGLQTHLFAAEQDQNVLESNSAVVFSFLVSLEEFSDILRTPGQASESKEEKKRNDELARIPVVLASSTKLGIPVGLSPWMEPAEELYPGKLTLGDDLIVAFSKKENINVVKKLVKECGLEAKLQVEPMEVLETATKLDKILAPYLYDIYNLKKWAANHTNT